MYKTGSVSVDQIGQLHFEGNITPINWFKHITFENGKPDLVAIFILGEIVYWHRPTIVRDEYTGQVTEVRKKFKADLLQRSYESFAEQFGFTKRQAREAVIRLEELHIIKREFRTVMAPKGPVSNVLFIHLNPEAVKHITFKEGPYDVSMSQGVWHPNVGGVALERRTYTEITTNNSTTTTGPESEAPVSSPEPPAETLFMFYEANIMTMLSPIQMQSLFAYLDDFGGQEEIIRHAIKIACDRDRRSFGMVEKLLKEWAVHKLPNLDRVLMYEKEKYEKPKATAGSGRNAKPDLNSFRD